MASSTASRASRASGRVSSNRYSTRPSPAGVATTATRPVRKAVRAALSSASAVTAKPESRGRRDTIGSAAPCVTAMTPTCTISAGRLRNAIASPVASRIGKTNDQKIASGSRRNSLSRTLTSCAKARYRTCPPPSAPCPLPSPITELSPGERDEDVLERRRVRTQLGESEGAALELSDQRRHRLVQVCHPEREPVVGTPSGAHAGDRRERRLVERRAVSSPTGGN